MTTSNIEKITCLIKQLGERIPTNDLQDLVIFGSSAIALNGIDLQREIDDLDLFASESVFERFKAKLSCHEIEKSPGISYLQLGIPKIEIWKSFPGVAYSQVKKNATKLEQSGGMLVASIEDLRIWKKAQGRQKDKKDLQKME